MESLWKRHLGGTKTFLGERDGSIIRGPCRVRREPDATWSGNKWKGRVPSFGRIGRIGRIGPPPRSQPAAPRRPSFPFTLIFHRDAARPRESSCLSDSSEGKAAAGASLLAPESPAARGRRRLDESRERARGRARWAEKSALAPEVPGPLGNIARSLASATHRV
ncbi:hypothetical protein KM043_000270 [Ampulex compressa]|nr:hypothetical protein KM043_000270 [Ampulex compressa]